MLSPEYLRRITEGSEQIAEELHQYIVSEIVSRMMVRIGKGEDYILNNADAGIIPTEEDTKAIENGEVPPSLLFDKIHGNAKFYELLAKQIYERGQELRYWN